MTSKQMSNVDAASAELVAALEALPERVRAPLTAEFTAIARRRAPKTLRPRRRIAPAMPARWVSVGPDVLDGPREPVRGLGHPSRLGEPHGLAPAVERFARLGQEGNDAA